MEFDVGPELGVADGHGGSPHPPVGEALGEGVGDATAPPGVGLGDAPEAVPPPEAVGLDPIVAPPLPHATSAVAATNDQIAKEREHFTELHIKRPYRLTFRKMHEGAPTSFALLGTSNATTSRGRDAILADKFARAEMAEIGLATVAENKSKNPQVLAFAPMDAATKTNLETRPSDFDAAYKTVNEQRHAKALKLLSTEISSGSDSKIVSYADRRYRESW